MKNIEEISRVPNQKSRNVCVFSSFGNKTLELELEAAMEIENKVRILVHGTIQETLGLYSWNAT